MLFQFQSFTHDDKACYTKKIIWDVPVLESEVGNKPLLTTAVFCFCLVFAGLIAGILLSVTLLLVAVGGLIVYQKRPMERGEGWTFVAAVLFLFVG